MPQKKEFMKKIKLPKRGENRILESFWTKRITPVIRLPNGDGNKSIGNYVRLLILILILSVLLSSCGWNPFGIPTKFEIETTSELGPDTLSRIDKLNETIANGVEVGPETRKVIEELNQTISQGIKGGFDEATLRRIDKLLRVVEDGVKIGLDEETLKTVNDLIGVIDNAPDKWESTGTEIIQTLENSAGTVAKEMADEVKGVIVEARINSQQLVATGGTEFRCNVDFLGAKAGETANEFIGRSILGRLKDIIAGKEDTPEISIPWVCQIIPDQIELRWVGDRLVPSKEVIGLTGYNYVDANLPTAVVVDEKGSEIVSIQLFPYRKTPYEIQLNLQEIDFSPVPNRARIEFRWPNIEHRCAIALLLPQKPEPTAEFKVDTRTGTVPLVVAFTDISTRDPTSWKWEFGDGETSTVQNPSYTYESPGTYTVKLTATNAQGSDVAVKENYIVVSGPLPKPDPDFKVDTRTGTAPLQVLFTDLSKGNPTSWFWNFGFNEGSSRAQNPIYTYTKPGTYNVTLTVSNEQGSRSKTYPELVIVTSSPPVASFTWQEISELRVQFTDQSQGNPTSWIWEFGDGTTSAAQNPSHVYNEGGKYQVNLTVATAPFASDTTQQDIVVKQPWRVVSKIGPFGGPFGDWGTEERCPEGQWAFAVSLRVEDSQGSGDDDTALNGIRLSCGTPGYARDISSTAGIWGNWSEIKKCTNGFITGARLRIEPRQGGGDDDTGGVDAEFFCQDGQILGGDIHLPWGEWKDRQSCPAGTAICGIQTKVEKSQGSGEDDTALNDVIYSCCWLP
jgi:PKD repeat protein